MTTETIRKRERLARVLRDVKKNRRKTRSEAEIAVYTAGYQGLSIDEFLSLLFEKGIKRIIDVRKNSVSRVFGFHKSTLSWLPDRLEIEYTHRPELGVPSEWRRNLNRPEDYEAMLNRYENEILSVSGNSLREVSEMMIEKPSVLMCREADPLYCHRSRLAEIISNISNMGVRDLRASNEERL
ncbi:MAG: DUF488 domain-containing protein [bacterium]